MNDKSLQITEKIEEEICRFFIKGRVDSNNADALQDRLDKALESGQRTIILNMSQIEYLSSIGIRVVLKIVKQAEEAGGSVKIERPSKIVRNVLGMAALKEILI